jgi:hypothetical protein
VVELAAAWNDHARCRVAEGLCAVVGRTTDLPEANPGSLTEIRPVLLKRRVSTTGGGRAFDEPGKDGRCTDVVRETPGRPPGRHAGVFD